MHILKNGGAKRNHCHVINIARIFLLSGSILQQFWNDVISYYLISLMPSTVLFRVYPHERLYFVPPTYVHLRVFGCICLVLLPPTSELSFVLVLLFVYFFLDIAQSIKAIVLII